MGSYTECRSIEIAATPQRCFDALTDYEHLPEWQESLREARVLERDERGQASVVEFVVDARVRKVRYRLRQLPDPPHRLGSEYLGGDFRDFAGEWRFLPAGADSTLVELELDIDPGRFVPGPVRGLIRDAVMGRALQDLKAHVEQASVPAR